MWLLKLQYEFYNPKFYDTERNFSHQSQRQGWKQKTVLRVTDFHDYQNLKLTQCMHYVLTVSVSVQKENYPKTCELSGRNSKQTRKTCEVKL